MPDLSVPLLYWPLMLLAAYLLGSIPFAQVVARAHGIDLRRVGGRNVGAGNVTRQLGKGWGALAALLDGLKGLIPVYLARRAGLGPGAAGMVGLAAVVGHNWSIWMRGRSGRGLATSAGLLLALDPALMIWPAGWAIAGWRIGGGLAGFIGWGLLPLVSVTLARPPTETILLLLLSTVLIGRRIQGNPDSSWEPMAVWRRAVLDEVVSVRDVPDGVEDPLTP
ncbi:MAG: glycerol-3-phosphate acyltransferase [Actinobacteria bacterium]|nr:glycerol-3-phosphate acyltransferase [Actinomycetota bacterium]